MIRKLLFSLTLFLAVAVGQTPPAVAEEVITLMLPQAVIAKAFTALLPLPIDARSKSVQGDIVIKNIKDFKLGNNQLACRLHLAGSNLGLVTDIAGHEIKLKVGAVEIEVQANATLRYDAAQQTLFVKPVVRNLSPATGKNANADIGQALVALLNGQEFPLTLQNLSPIIAKSGAKTITINTRITDISTQPEALKLSMVPVIATK
jgi:hypothetical protein